MVEEPRPRRSKLFPPKSATWWSAVPHVFACVCHRSFISFYFSVSCFRAAVYVASSRRISIIPLTPQRADVAQRYVHVLTRGTRTHTAEANSGPTKEKCIPPHPKPTKKKSDLGRDQVWRFSMDGTKKTGRAVKLTAPNISHSRGFLNHRNPLGYPTIACLKLVHNVQNKIN